VLHTFEGACQGTGFGVDTPSVDAFHVQDGDVVDDTPPEDDCTAMYIFGCARKETVVRVAALIPSKTTWTTPPSELNSPFSCGKKS
jgi:hypothetical protein